MDQMKDDHITEDHTRPRNQQVITTTTTTTTGGSRLQISLFVSVIHLFYGRLLGVKGYYTLLRQYITGL